MRRGLPSEGNAVAVGSRVVDVAEDSASRAIIASSSEQRGRREQRGERGRGVDALTGTALQKNLVNIKADYAKVPNKWNIHLIPRYSADSALSSIADKRPIFDLP